MSSSMLIFLSTGLAPREAARRLADALGGDPGDDEGYVYVAVRLEDAEVGGEVKENIYAGPTTARSDRQSVLDGYDTVFDVRRDPDDDDDARLVAARNLFEEIIERLRWPALLVDDFDTLLAAWRADVGRTDFPDHTSTYGEHQDRWRPYAL